MEAIRVIRSGRYVVRLILSHVPKLAILLIAVGGISAVMPALSAWAFGRGVDAIVSAVSDGGFRTVLPWVILLVASRTLQNGLSSADAYLIHVFEVALRRSVDSVMLEKCSSMCCEEMDDPKTYDLLANVGSSPALRLSEAFLSIREVLGSLLTVVTLVALLAQAGATLLGIVLLVAVVIVIMDLRSGQQQYKESADLAEDSRRADYLTELLTGREEAKELRLYGAVSYLRIQWRAANQRLLRTRARRLVGATGLSVVSTLLKNTLTLGTLLWAVRLLASMSISVGEFATMTDAVIRVSSHLAWFSSLARQCGSWASYVVHYREFLDIPDDGSTTHGSQFPSGWRSIRFENVSYTYRGSDRPAIHDLTLELHRGETLALVGENGSGKSTIVKLLIGIYEPNRGRITVDGIDRSEIGAKNWRKAFAGVFQDFARYQLTLGENIGFGDIDHVACTERIERAANKGGADAIAAKLLRGYDAYLGRIWDTGTDVSGGEWQRIAVSRAFMATDRIVVLDEPSSALDPAAEAEVYRHFADLIREGSGVIVSHRLGSTRVADRIVVIKDGRIAEIGNHDTLMRRTGEYSSMYRAQAMWYSEGAIADEAGA